MTQFPSCVPLCPPDQWKLWPLDVILLHVYLPGGVENGGTSCQFLLHISHILTHYITISVHNYNVGLPFKDKLVKHTLPVISYMLGPTV